MKNVNQRRQYSNIKQFNDCCATALHVATDRWVESLGATVRTGGEIDFIVCNPQQKIDKNTARMLRKASHILGDKTKSAGLGPSSSG